MESYLILVVAFTFVWALYAAVRVGPSLARRWKTCGEVAAVLVFTVVELGILVALLKPS